VCVKQALLSSMNSEKFFFRTEL